MKKDLVVSNWEEDYLALENLKSTEELWELLKSKLLELRNKYVPKQKSTKTSWKDIGGFPIDKTLKEAIRHKQSSHLHLMSALVVPTLKPVASNMRGLETKSQN